jgi:hypothetical protein
MGNGMAQTIEEKYKVLIEDEANGIVVGESEGRERDVAIAISVGEYVDALRRKTPSLVVSVQDIMNEIRGNKVK